ncbi:MAG: tRNA (adenosine(37)-N6)-dimethylallyltransferase MiaA [Chloroflexi bacterium]|nr:tRNA (adenosine(37)-N6)-dimethylallyltransferase MiaA [Chloroflexota bacterium]MQC27149.1 tRNA (adenosine(37)-N6)-dimethylallyltransferase MiaA [Chloroflexota bacterium]
MPSTESRPRLLVLLGPTAVGKTELSIRLAERFDMEIVSADSRLLYRGLDIGTAKPSLEQRARVPHHLIDVADPDETWSLALFQEAAHTAIVEIAARHRTPLLVGGTGQYLRAILEGWSPPELPPRPGLRAALEAWTEEIGPQGLHARLARLDPTAAANIDARNLRRTIRALEVNLSTGRRFSAQRGRGQSRYQVLQIGLIRPRLELYQRIDQRNQNMLDAGWLDEIRALLEKGYSPGLPSLSAIGYQQLTRHLQGELTLDEALLLIKRSTRAFVRRQANWFKPDDPAIHWFELGEEKVFGQIEKLAEDFLSASSKKR